MKGGSFEGAGDIGFQKVRLPPAWLTSLVYIIDSLMAKVIERR